MVIPYLPEFFDLFYVIAIIVSVSFLFYMGIRRNYPVITWSLSILLTLMLITICSIIATIEPTDWKSIFTEGKLTENTGRTILGALAGCMIGLYISVRYFKISKEVFDWVGYILPIAMFIQRIGCLFVGCCFGSATNVPWAIQYEKYSIAHILQSNSGVIETNDPITLHVHPNPIYQMMACIVIFLLLYFYFRHKLLRAGNLFFTSIALYLTSRFITEFFRAPEANGFAGQNFLSLKIVQWLVLIAIAIIFMCIYYREKDNNQPIKTEANVTYLNFSKSSLFIILSLYIICLNILPDTERAALFICLSIVSLFFIFQSRNIIYTSALTKLAFVILPAFIFLTSQTTVPTFPYNDSKNIQISSGASYGHYSYRQEIPSSCYSGPLHYYDAKYINSEIGFKYVIPRKKLQGFTIAGGLMVGGQKEVDHYDNRIVGERERSMMGIYFGLGYDWKAFGFYTGMTFGDLLLYNGNETYCPDLSLRVGNQKTFFIQVGFGNLKPGPNGNSQGNVEFGTGLLTENLIIRGGVSEFGWYVRPEYYFKKLNLSVDAFATIYSNSSYLSVQPVRYGLTCKAYFNKN